MNFKPVIKWSGSKRSQASTIVSLAPDSYRTYFEPFIGGGSILYALNPPAAICGDICSPLIDLWKVIQSAPDSLIDQYRKDWLRLQEEGHPVFYEIRGHFNKTQDPRSLFFLSRTCVNGLIRFNAKGEFNNSLHHSRPGINPDRLKPIVDSWSERIQGVEFLNADYRITIADASKGDFVYLDPPYLNTKGRYYGGIEFSEFLSCLEDLNMRGVKYALSFDGYRGDKDYSAPIPKELYKRKEMLASGNSAFKKVQDKISEQVYESLYLNY